MDACVELGTIRNHAEFWLKSSTQGVSIASFQVCCMHLLNGVADEIEPFLSRLESGA